MLTRAITVIPYAAVAWDLPVNPHSRTPPVDADEGISQLYAAQWRQLVRLASLMVRDQALAEDIVQDAFIAVHGKWGRLRDPERALPYLRRAVVNRATSSLRHRGVVQRHLATQLGRPEPVADSSETDALDRERRTTVLAAMAALPPRQRAVIALRYYLDLSEAEIAQTLGISRGAVKSHASRGVAALRSRLEHLMKDLS